MIDLLKNHYCTFFRHRSVDSILSRPLNVLEVLRQRGSAREVVVAVEIVVEVIVELLHAVAQVLVLLLLLGGARLGLDPHDGLRLAAEAGVARLGALLVLVEVEKAVGAQIEALVEAGFDALQTLNTLARVSCSGRRRPLGAGVHPRRVAVLVVVLAPHVEALGLLPPTTVGGARVEDAEVGAGVEARERLQVEVVEAERRRAEEARTVERREELAAVAAAEEVAHWRRRRRKSRRRNEVERFHLATRRQRVARLGHLQQPPLLVGARRRGGRRAFGQRGQPVGQSVLRLRRHVVGRAREENVALRVSHAAPAERCREQPLKSKFFVYKNTII